MLISIHEKFPPFAKLKCQHLLLSMKYLFSLVIVYWFWWIKWFDRQWENPKSEDERQNVKGHAPAAISEYQISVKNQKHRKYLSQTEFDSKTSLLIHWTSVCWLNSFECIMSAVRIYFQFQYIHTNTLMQFILKMHSLEIRTQLVWI